MTNAANELLTPEGVTLAGRPYLDARMAALLRLKLFFSLLRFYRAGDAGGQPYEYRVPLANICEEAPDQEKDLKLPAIAFLSGGGIHEELALGAPILCEDSVGRYGAGTALEQTGVYREQFIVEAWASGKGERRGLLVGLKLAMQSAPGSYAIRMKLPDYYDQIATFMLDESTYADDPDVIKGRRRGQLKVTMLIPEVRLVSYPEFKPMLRVEVLVETQVDVDGEVVLDVVI